MVVRDLISRYVLGGKLLRLRFYLRFGPNVCGADSIVYTSKGTVLLVPLKPHGSAPFLVVY